MDPEVHPLDGRPRTSARFRLALSYAAFLVFAGVVVLGGVYFAIRFGPNPPATGPFRPDGALAPNQEMALLQVSVVILTSLAAIGLAGGWIIAGWVLRPLQRISRAAEIAATGRLDHRIRLAGRNDEFRQLADTFDDMLERLHDAFATQERFAANASHELRTPLAVTATMLEVARANPENQDYPNLLERLAITNERSIGLTEALLRLADANSVTAASEPVDLAELARAALCDLADEARGRCVTFDEELDHAPAVGDAALLQQLVSNLLRNAIRHNDSRGRARVVSGRSQQGRGVFLRVENTGSRYTPEDVRRLREPFVRGAGRVTVSGERKGYGLGLALASRVASVHRGELTLVPRVDGGLIATLTLPTPEVR